MKKILAAFILFILAVPLSAQAHSGLSSSNPAEGETVSGLLDEITLVFETQIEAGSTMVIESAGQTFTFDDISISGDKLQGMLAEKELPNGAYSIQWTIIGADGHPIKGEVRFEVAMKTYSAEAVVEEKAVEASIPAQTAAPTKEAQIAETAARQDGSGESMLGTVVIFILAIAISVIAYRIYKMKK